MWAVTISKTIERAFVKMVAQNNDLTISYSNLQKYQFV